MHIEFIPERYFIGSIKFKLDIPYHELIEILEQEEWIDINWRTKRGWEGFSDWSKRFEVKNFNAGYKSPVLNDIVEFLQSEETQNKALDLLYSWDPQFGALWGMDKEMMRDFVWWHAHFHKDLPGYFLGPHTDYRRLVATGLIMLTETDDPDVSTTFMWDGKVDNAIRMTTNYGDGWLHVNTHQNIHMGQNKSNKDRYSIMVGMTIKHPSEYGIANETKTNIQS
jgi:hypothetical protein